MRTAIPISVIAIIIFILTFSYIAVGVLYNDWDNLADLGYNLETPKKLDEWFNPQYNEYLIWFEEEWGENPQFDTIIIIDWRDTRDYGNLSAETWLILNKHRKLIYNHFFEAGDGMEFLLHLKNSGDWFKENDYNQIVNLYNRYLYKFGLILNDEDITRHKQLQKNAFQVVQDIFGLIKDGIIQIFKIMTFQLPNIPSDLNLVLTCIFTPLWIILLIGFLPLIAEFIKAIGELVPF